MTGLLAWRLDWRSQFANLKPYFEGRGGVIHVHAGSGSPASNFAKTIRRELKVGEWPYPWSTVQIDPSNASTHYVEDIVQQIAKNVQLAVPATSHASQQPITVNVGTDIDAGGDVALTGIDVSVSVDKSMHESKKIEQLCGILRQVLETRRLALIFVDTHKSEAETLSNWGRKLWEGALEKLLDSGLLVIDIFDPMALVGKSPSWPPDPFLVLQLPDRYDDETRAHALDDLTSVALEERWFATTDEARAFAFGIIMSSNDVRGVYAGLGLAVAGVGLGSDLGR